MKDSNQDKQLEEHIRKIFSDYTVNYSEDQKKDLINKFHHLKLHSKKINIPITDILLNKTFLLVFGSVITVILLIYIIGHLSSSEKNKSNLKNNHSSLPADSVILNKKDSVSHKTKDSSHHSVITKNNTIQIPSKTRDTANQENKVLSNITDSTVISKQQLQKKDDDANPPSKKKRKKRKSNITDTTSNQQLSPIEPKIPKTDANINEE